MGRFQSLFLSFAICVPLAACTVPRQGALTSELNRGSADGRVVVRPIDEAVVRAERRLPLAPLPDQLLSVPTAQSDLIHAGDKLGVTIIEGMSDSVPSAIGGRLELPEVDVAQDGTVNIPFAGKIAVAGKSLDDVRLTLEARLRRSLYRPQVQLRRLSSPNQSVSIVGEVSKGGAYPLSPSMLRMTDLIGAAGVKSEKAQQVQLELRRGGETHHIALKTLLADGRYNVPLQAGDVVSVIRKPQFVTLMGAISTPGRFEISGENYSILDALAEARGLNDKSADPSGIYMFQAQQGGDQASPVTVISIDIRDPSQVVLARQLHLMDGDLIYVSTASFAQTVKVLDIISRTMTPFTRMPGV